MKKMHSCTVEKERKKNHAGTSGNKEIVPVEKNEETSTKIDHKKRGKRPDPKGPVHKRGGKFFRGTPVGRG